MLTEYDQQENLRVIRQAKRATHRIYDGEQKRLVEVADHKTRLAAAMLDLAYREGKPVERQISAHATVTDFPTLLEKLRQSPAYLALENSEQKTVLNRESTAVLQEPQAPDHC